MIIPGILILSGNKTYGRARNSKGVQTKLLYKAVPHYLFSQSSCLIPYEIKHLGFSKALENLFVTINLQTNTLDQVIGPVSSLQAFYEYQLYVHGLKNSINPLRKKITPLINDDTIYSIASTYGLDRNTNPHTYIFSIDPETSVDFDDALSIRVCPHTGNFSVSVYIANVPVWLDLVGVQLDQIPNCSTIYLPPTSGVLGCSPSRTDLPDSSKCPMLPSILSDDLCSLWAGKPRAAFVLNLTINPSNNSIISKNWSNQIITVNKNWSYSDPKLETNSSYQMLKELTCKMLSSDCLDSHQIVEYWMCQMNLAVGQELDAHGMGIFRQAELGELIDPPPTCPSNVAQTLQLIHSASSYYVRKIPGSAPITHSILNVESYLHVTSPIRRLVDIVNMGLFQQNICGIEFKNLNFALACTDELVEKINIQSRSIRQVQNKCNALHALTTRPDQNEILETWAYLNGQVYIPKYKIFVSPANMPQSSNPYTKYNVKLYLFENADTLYKKAKAEIILK